MDLAALKGMFWPPSFKLLATNAERAALWPIAPQKLCGVGNSSQPTKVSLCLMKI